MKWDAVYSQSGFSAFIGHHQRSRFEWLNRWFLAWVSTILWKQQWKSSSFDRHEEKKLALISSTQQCGLGWRWFHRVWPRKWPCCLLDVFFFFSLSRFLCGPVKNNDERSRQRSIEINNEITIFNLSLCEKPYYLKHAFVKESEHYMWKQLEKREKLHSTMISVNAQRCSRIKQKSTKSCDIGIFNERVQADWRLLQNSM